MNREHWGELPPKRKYEQGIPNIMADIERCMDSFCLSEYSDDTETGLVENIVYVIIFKIIFFKITFSKVGI